MPIKRIGIAVGGGPAPGTNGVISAVAIEALKVGCVPIGFHDGFEWLARHFTDEQHTLAIDEVSRIHLRGGIHLDEIPTGGPAEEPLGMSQHAVGHDR